MEIRTEEFILKVLKNIDENGEIQIDRMEAGYETASVSDLISEVMGDVAAEVIRNAEWKEIDEWEEMPGEVDWIEPGRGEVALPSDFLRLMEFRMSDWRRSVTTAVNPDSEVYALRFNSSFGRRNIRKVPMVAVWGGAGGGRLEFIGSIDPGAFIARAGYLPHPLEEDGEVLRIPRSLLQRVVDAVACKVFSVIRN